MGREGFWESVICFVFVLPYYQLLGCIWENCALGLQNTCNGPRAYCVGEGEAGMEKSAQVLVGRTETAPPPALTSDWIPASVGTVLLYNFLDHQTTSLVYLIELFTAVLTLFLSTELCKRMNHLWKVHEKLKRVSIHTACGMCDLLSVQFTKSLDILYFSAKTKYQYFRSRQCFWHFWDYWASIFFMLFNIDTLDPYCIPPWYALCSRLYVTKYQTQSFELPYTETAHCFIFMKI